jgi:thiamine pyrophosphokinase
VAGPLACCLDALRPARLCEGDPQGTAACLCTCLGAGGLGGRLDHCLSNLSTLYMFAHLDVVLCGDGNLARLVRPGRTVIRPAAPFEGPTCGLIPIGGAAVGTTSGLKWNLGAPNGDQMSYSACQI